MALHMINEDLKNYTNHKQCYWSYTSDKNIIYHLNRELKENCEVTIAKQAFVKTKDALCKSSVKPTKGKLWSSQSSRSDRPKFVRPKFWSSNARKLSEWILTNKLSGSQGKTQPKISSIESKVQGSSTEIQKINT